LPLRESQCQQIEFINVIIDHLAGRGIMDSRLLYEASFAT
jgi:hypothetical protein